MATTSSSTDGVDALTQPLKSLGVTVEARVWIESKKLWHIVGPTIVTRVANYSMNIVAQAFAGHLGDVQLAAMTFANTVIVGFNFGLMLGMASALETLCGQAFGAKRYSMLGVYLQRSWIVLFLSCFLLVPIYVFASPILKLLGQPDDVAEMTGVVTLCFIPLHFSFAFMFPVQRFLQSQLKTELVAQVALAALLFNVLASWLSVYVFDFGIVGLSVALVLSWWIIPLGYTVCGGCPLTWTGFSSEAFSGLWDFFKLSAASGLMLCLENWYYRGIWGGMIFGGTALQTLILAAITIRCDWDKEAEKAKVRLHKWSHLAPPYES